MGCKGIKKYVRVCGNHHAQFEGFRLPVGAIYGRIDKTFFVSIHRDERQGKIRVYLKKGGEWEHKNIPINSEICKMISGFIAQNGEPVVGKYNATRDSAHYCTKRVKYFGKNYKEYGYEFTLPDVEVDKELSGMVPGLRTVGKYDAKYKKPDCAWYRVEYCGRKFTFYGSEEARKFCRENGLSESLIQQEFYGADSVAEVGNECSFWEIHKDLNRKVAWSKKYKAYV